MAHRRFTSLLFASLLLVSAACDHSSGGGGTATSPAASTFNSDVPVAWSDLLYTAIKTESYSPPVASRIIGYVGVTGYEAVVDGMPDHHSLAGQLNGLAPLPSKQAGVHDWAVVANSALAEIMRGLFATASAPTLASIDALEAQFDTQFQASVGAATYARSVARGQELAAEILAWSASDGLTTWNNCAFTPPIGPGLWVPTPPAFAAPLQPCWGKLRPFVLLYGAECPALAPPPYSTTPGSAFYNEALEVRDTVDNLTAEQVEIALFWADGPGATGTPPGHWISIAEQCVVQEGLSLDVSSEAFARIGLAVADAFISCWDMKYYYNLLRPITYIQDPAGLNDPTWTTPTGIGTPNFPEYTSGHSVQSGAVAQVLTDLLGDIAFTDSTHSPGKPARSFTSFFAAADEAALSRLYGGIHYRAAIERGIEQGRCVGQVILDNVRFLE